MVPGDALALRARSRLNHGVSEPERYIARRIRPIFWNKHEKIKYQRWLEAQKYRANTVTAQLHREAICNAVGKRVIGDWKDFESASPNAKLRLLCERLQVPYDEDQEPWSTVRWLVRQRNAIAHAKPQLLDEEHVWTRDEFDRKRKESPLSDLEKELSLGNAKRALKAVEEVLLRVTQAIPVGERFGLYSDGWEGSASMIHDD